MLEIGARRKFSNYTRQTFAPDLWCMISWFESPDMELDVVDFVQNFLRLPFKIATKLRMKYDEKLMETT